jgi:hypothetical protein
MMDIAEGERAACSVAFPFSSRGSSSRDKPENGMSRDREQIFLSNVKRRAASFAYAVGEKLEMSGVQAGKLATKTAPMLLAVRRTFELQFIPQLLGNGVYSGICEHRIVVAHFDEAH